MKFDVNAAKLFASHVVLLKARAGELGLFETMHALELAVTKVGWEIAAQKEEIRCPKEKHNYVTCMKCGSVHRDDQECGRGCY